MLILSAIVLSFLVAVGVSILTQKDDTPIEEIAEEVLDESLEEVLHLPEGSIDIDVTPKSPENKKAGS